MNQSQRFIENPWLDVDGDPVETRCSDIATVKAREGMRTDVGGNYAYDYRSKLSNELHATLYNILCLYSNMHGNQIKMFSAKWDVLKEFTWKLIFKILAAQLQQADLQCLQGLLRHVTNCFSQVPAFAPCQRAIALTSNTKWRGGRSRKRIPA